MNVSSVKLVSNLKMLRQVLFLSIFTKMHYILSKNVPLIIPPGNKVQWIPHFPSQTQDSLLFEPSDSRLYICGGKNADGAYEETCYRYTYTSSTYQFWKKSPSLGEFRIHSAQNVMSK